MKRVVSPIDLEGNLIVQTLMWPMMIVFHLPQFQLVPSFLGIPKAELREQLVFVGPIGAFDKPIAPRLAFGNQGMNPATAFDGFSKAGLPLRMSGIFHCKAHRIVGKSDEKGGKLSNERSKTPAIVALS
jgi:hypothetical protein